MANKLSRFMFPIHTGKKRIRLLIEKPFNLTHEVAYGCE